MITDGQKSLLLTQYHEHGILKKEIRSYEVSLWTLQDDFITVLKWSDVEQKGRIENPKMTLNVDGTQKFTMSIPMYYRENGEFVENPNWYSIADDSKLIEGMRKLKVIFNKGAINQAVFEFLIISIHESHQEDILTCEVESDGFAFQELGKIGYKLELSSEVFEEVYKEWQEKGYWTDHTGAHRSTKPLQTLDYWCQECCFLKTAPSNVSQMDSRTWYYTVSLNHAAYESRSGATRSSGKVYEESYPIYSNDSTESMLPSGIISYREKARPMDINNSNLYNITQDLAKTFGIFCRYEYVYDENYHIIGRKIIFYNNFIQDNMNNLSLTYPYTAANTQRVIESTDITTKLYVLGADNDSTLEGQNTIVNSAANYSKEDYILNFDYMHDIGAITDEQYEEINPYLKAMRTYNEQLIETQQALSTYEIKVPELEAKKTVYTASIKLDQEQITQNEALHNELDSLDKDNDGNITLAGANCDQGIVHVGESGEKFVNLSLTNKGIIDNTIKVYTTWSSGTLSNEITSFDLQHDEYNNLIKLIFTTSISVEKVYLTYKYNPQIYRDNIVRVWQTKLAEDRESLRVVLRELGAKSTSDAEYSNYVSSLGDLPSVSSAYASGLYKKIEDAKSTIKQKTSEKKARIQKFEQAMGPALREGYWQPEDYKDYGETYSETSMITSNDITSDTGTGLLIAWDTELFDDEEKLYYQVGVTNSYEYYPCIDLQAIFGNNIPTDLDSYSVVWKQSSLGTPSWNNAKDVGVLAVGSQAVIKFIKVSNTYKPVLMLTGTKAFSGDQLARLMITGEARLEQYSTSVSASGVLSISHGSSSRQYSLSGKWLFYKDSNNTMHNTWPSNLQSFGTYVSSKDEVVTAYPRIKFSSLALKTDASSLSMTYGGNFLNYAVDYYVSIRNTLRSGYYYTEYFITVKPESLIKYGYTASKTFNIQYILSNANTAIYLDAKKISEENAKPKVSYTVAANLVDTSLLSNLYMQLARIVMINDAQLKLENSFGYISELELNLDAPWEDQIEVKNYSNKFEDLFSSIVAQTEEMRRNDSAIAAMIAGNSPLSAEGLDSTLAMQDKIFQAYLDSYFDSSEVVKMRLKSIFDEAGQILADSNKSLNQIRNLSTKNAAILDGFVTNVAYELTSKVVKSTTRPASFKVGDIWIQTDTNGNEIGRYVATASSGDVTGNITGKDGYVRTYDGTLASITGANMSVDTQAGKIDIYGEHEVTLRSGEHVYIGASDVVDIVGNREVNIGGTTINIGSASANGTVGGVNIVAAAYDNFDTTANVSKVLIHPNQVDISSSALNLTSSNLSMVASDINMTAGSKIILVASQGAAANTAAIDIDADEGIWIGSGKKVSLFAGTNQSGANVQMTPTQIIMGITSGNNASVFDLKPEYLVFAVGTTSTNFSSSSVTIDYSTSLTGMKLTKDSFGLAVGSGAQRSVILANTDGIAIGAGNTPITSGSYVKISGTNGIEFGSLADLYINTDNFKLQTHSRDKGNNGQYTDGETIMALGTGLQSIGYNTTYDTTTHQLMNGNDAVTGANVRLLVNKNGLYVYGTVYATDGEFTGVVYARDGVFTGTVYANDGSFTGTVYANSGSFTGTVYASDGSFNGSVTATSFLTTVANANAYLKADSNGIGFFQSSDNAALLNIDASGHVIANTISIDSTYFKLTSYATGSTPVLGIYYDDNGIMKTAIEYTATSGLYVHGNIINDQMAFITTQGYSLGGNTYNPGIYVTNNNITGTERSILYQAPGDSQPENYYAWRYNNRTYYCKYNNGTSVAASSVGTILAYQSIITAVAPLYAAQAVAKAGPNNSYVYTVYYITDANGNIVKDESNQDIQYDGSSNPNPPAQFPNWYVKIPAGSRSSLAYEYRTETSQLEVVTLDANAVLTRDLDVTFSVVADSGLTTISTGRIGNFYVSPQGFTRGSISGGMVSNTELNGCVIEGRYSTGYYARCFYDYTYNRDTGILVLKRIDQTTEVIDIKTTVNVVTTGGSTGDTSTPSGGNSGTSSADDCPNDCTGSCEYFCDAACEMDCEGRCVTGCSTSCTAVCASACQGNCGTECSSSCLGSCGNGCGGNCGSSCGEACSYNSTNSGNDEPTDCSGSACDQNCGEACSLGCSTACSTSCTGVNIQDASCFAPNTQVLLVSGYTMAIQNLLPGLNVMSYNESSKRYFPATILSVKSFNGINVYDVYLSSNSVLTLTASHPLLTETGWKAIDVQAALLEHRVHGLQQLSIGDKLVNISNTEITVVDIIYREDLSNTDVYNIDVYPNDTYIVENVVAHNAEVK